MRVAVIGAGLAGAACGRRLTAAGAHVALFDKGRGPGGRASTRRVTTPLGDAQFDHGAQYFTARDPAFQEVVMEWCASGAAALWGAPLGTWRGGAVHPAAPAERYVGVPGMNAIVRAALAGLEVRFGARAVALTGQAGAWRVTVEDRGGARRDEGPFDAVAVATPAEQAPALTAAAAPSLAQEAERVRSAPCWAVMAAFERRVALDVAGVTVSDSPLAWAAREPDKPGRPGLEAWTLHADPTWSRAHLEDDAETVAATLADAFAVMAGARPVWTAAHRWRFAQVEASRLRPAGWDAQARIGVCGDWRLGPRLECAWLSGDALGALMAAP